MILYTLWTYDGKYVFRITLTVLLNYFHIPTFLSSTVHSTVNQMSDGSNPSWDDLQRSFFVFDKLELRQLNWSLNMQFPISDNCLNLSGFCRIMEQGGIDFKTLLRIFLSLLEMAKQWMKHFFIAEA